MQRRNPRSHRQAKRKLKRMRFQVFYLLGMWVTLSGVAAVLKWLFDLLVQWLW